MIVALHLLAQAMPLDPGTLPLLASRSAAGQPHRMALLGHLLDLFRCLRGDDRGLHASRREIKVRRNQPVARVRR